MTVGVLARHNYKAFLLPYFFKIAHTECHLELSLRDFIPFLYRLKKRSDNPLAIVTKA